MVKVFLIIVLVLSCFFISEGISRPLEEIIESGVLRVGMRATPINFNVTPDGEYRGLNYTFAQHLADFLGVKLEVVKIDAFNQYFMKDGVVPENVQTDESVVYTPDIFKNNVIDVATETITYVPWRAKLFNLTPAIENKQIIYSSNRTIFEKRIDISRRYADLKNVTFIIRNNTSFQANYDANIKQKLENVETIYTDMGDVGCIEAILDGKADFGIMDAITFLGFNVLYNRRLALCFGVSRAEKLCWASSLEYDCLNEKLKEFFDTIMTDEVYNKAFIENFGMSYNIYLDLVSN